MSDLTATHRLVDTSAPLDIDGLREYVQQLTGSFATGGALALIGPMGAGKTTTIQSLVTALGYTGHPKSPSFVMQHIYQLPALIIEHWDLYRLLDAPAGQLLPLIREIGATGQLVLIEWPEPLFAIGWGDEAVVWQLNIVDETHRILSRWEPLTG